MRYTVYTCIVQGARGTMFWNLSKSEQKAFQQACYIGQEVEAMIPYLLEPHPAVFDPPHDVTLTTPAYIHDMDFIVRIHPEDENKALLLVANDTPDTINPTKIHFPSTWQIQSATSVGGRTGCTVSSNAVTLDFGPWEGRAFILTKSN